MDPSPVHTADPAKACGVHVRRPWDAIRLWMLHNFHSWLLLQQVPAVMVVVAAVCMCEHRRHQQQHSCHCDCKAHHGWWGAGAGHGRKTETAGQTEAGE